ncbi:MAG TPA: hypothetical protein VMZ52_13290 [Bryobacteraceae bacterium]|nr:hypothetical protein [Bryobacteraceae bacterium]
MPEPDPLELLAQRVSKLEKKPKDAWDKFASLSSLLSGLVIAVVAYFLTGSVNNALQERQLQFSNAKEMQELLSRMADPKTLIPDKESTALVLANFGRYAIAPLLNEIESGQEGRMTAGERGLQAIGFSDPTNACRELRRVVEKPSRIFHWYTHAAVIRLLRDGDCRDVLPVLQRYQSADPKSLYRDDPAPSPEDLGRVKQELENTLHALRRP